MVNSTDYGHPERKIAFTARPKVKSQSQIFRYGQSIFCRNIVANFQISLIYAFIGCPQSVVCMQLLCSSPCFLCCYRCLRRPIGSNLNLGGQILIYRIFANSCRIKKCLIQANLQVFEVFFNLPSQKRTVVAHEYSGQYLVCAKRLVEQCFTEFGTCPSCPELSVLLHTTKCTKIFQLSAS